MSNNRINKKYFPLLILLIIVISFLNSCKLLVKPPSKPAFEELSAKKINLYEWTDDLPIDGLVRSIEQSLTYYRRLPSTYKFNYNGQKYSPSDMVSSLEIFRDIFTSTNGKERARLLEERFHFFESINSDREAFFTGYYEPVLNGSPVATEKFSEPLYTIPDDLIDVDLGKFSKKWRNKKIVGRLKGKRLIPYDS